VADSNRTPQVEFVPWPAWALLGEKECRDRRVCWTDVLGQARWIRAHYNFGGMAQELEKTLPLEPDEKALAQGPTRRRVNFLLHSPAYLRLTDRRLAVLFHRLVGADRILEIPRGSFVSGRESAGWLWLTYQDKDATRTLAVLSRWPELTAALRSWTS
jgi:hypothetical protein